ncbi:hypothetical protein AB0H77_21835 [Streptomyces sp. NPDC050844]|uniref:hypothetical protein n=1 Tax=Streptomyces sp. NPDC050844 TaxID=3155790 RepID=UPI0033FE29B4
MTDKPITPTRIIPAGAPLPAPVSPPPKPPAAPPPAWPPLGSGPPEPPPPIVVHTHVTVDIPDHLPTPPEPEPRPRWWSRFRPGYNAVCLFLGMPLTGPWAWVLDNVRDEESLAGAWVMALVPLLVLAFADNVYRIAAAGAHPDLWMPKIRAFVARVLLLAAVTATVLTLPIASLVYALTGVRP